MPLKYKYKAQDEIPEAQRANYVEREIEVKDGHKEKFFVLDVEGVVERDRFVEFRDRNITLQKENEQWKSKLDGIDDPDKARALLKIAKDVEVDDAEKYLKKGGVDAMIAERTKAIREDLENKLRQATDKAQKAEQAFDREKIENHILTACRQLSLQPGAEVAILKLAEGTWTRRDNRIVSLDSNGNPKPSKDGTGDLQVTEWLEEDLLKRHPYLVKESSGSGAGGSGSGGSGGNGVNPWKKESWNMTAQGRLIREDRAKASRMARAAGQKIPGE